MPSVAEGIAESLRWICLAMAVVQIFGVGWYLIEIRNWRPTPELSSLGWLDVVARVERVFGIALSSADFESLPPVARSALTAGDVWTIITAKMQSEGKSPPPDGWPRLVAALAESLNVKPNRITRESRLDADLGMKNSDI
jgi:acyl carrier protein